MNFMLIGILGRGAFAKVYLARQPELADRLSAPSMRQLKQRVALRCTLSPLSVDEASAYIDTRIRVAGGQWTSIFTRSAVEAVHRGSHGIPRTISVICENALISGFALQRRPIGPDIVNEVCRDFDLERRSEASAAPPQAEPPRSFSFL